MLARGVPPEMFFHSLLCNEASHSAGRQMSAHMSDPSRRILSIVGPCGNNALQAVGIAEEIKLRPERSIVVCALGDGTSQQGEVLEAIAEAVRLQLRVLFLIEDNRLAISTRTSGKTFYCLPGREPQQEFYGLTIRHIDGRDVPACFESLESVVAAMRADRQPAMVVCNVERLGDHTNSDDQNVYRDRSEVEQALESGDPLRNLAAWLLESGIGAARLAAIDDEIAADARAAFDCRSPARQPATVYTAKAPLPPPRELVPSDPAETMSEAIRGVLRRRLEFRSPRHAFRSGYRRPQGRRFWRHARAIAIVSRPRGQRASERIDDCRQEHWPALAGGLPVAFIQFADFIPLAFNQILSEMGSMYWRTNGGWQCPMIVMAPCGGYRPGLGPFHAQTMESLLAHVPGIDVLHAVERRGRCGIARCRV